MVDACSGLLRDSVAVLEHFGVFVVNHSCQVTTVVQDQIQVLPIFERQKLLFQTPSVLFLGLSLPGEPRANQLLGPTIQREGCLHWGSGRCYGCSGVILCGEDVAT